MNLLLRGGVNHAFPYVKSDSVTMKKFPRYFLLLLSVVLIFSGCGILRSYKSFRLAQAGKITENGFFEEIPLEDRLGYAIIPVTIAGQTYDFMIDTGAPNVISRELFEALDLQAKTSMTIIDSQGERENADLVKVPIIRIGQVAFRNTAAAVIDLNANETLACLEIDGIVGANLMRLAKWQIDLADAEARFTDDLSRFNIKTEQVYRLPFFTNLLGTPYVGFSLYDVRVPGGVTIDFGSNGYLTLPRKTLAAVDSPEVKVVRSFGVNSIGVFNTLHFDTTEYAMIPSLSLGDLNLEETIVEFTAESEANTLGTDFFEHYTTTLDWEQETLFLEEQTVFNNKEWIDFGFNAFFTQNTLIVSKVILGTQPFQEGIRPGDQIMSYNGESVARMSAERWCTFINEPNGDTLHVEILQNDSLKSFTFFPEDLLWNAESHQ